MNSLNWIIQWELVDSEITDYVERKNLTHIPQDLIREMDYPGFKKVRGEIREAAPDSDIYLPMDNPYDSVPFGIIGIGTDALYKNFYWGVDESDQTGDDNVKKVFVCDGIKYIAKGAFWGNHNLEAVRLPQSLRLLGDSCFADTNINQIQIPRSVQYIGRACFRQCKKLKECTLPNGIRFIEDETFNRCYSLSLIELPKSLSSIGVKAFDESGLRMIVIPENVTHIAEKAFANCESLFYVTLPRSLTDISDDAFDPPEKNPLLTFYVYPGSYGLMWAREHGYPIKSAEV